MCRFLFVNFQALMDLSFKKQVGQGVPQLTDDGYLAIVEVVSEEQRSITKLIDAQISRDRAFLSDTSARR